MSAFQALVRRTPDFVPLRLSRNSKTGVSLNVPIVGSCRPTAACREYCYGLAGPIAMRDSLRLHVANLAALTLVRTDSDAESVAEAIAVQSADAGATFLRVNGVGDLTRESVRVLSALSVRHPRLVLWIATRKPELARLLPDAPNVQIMLSVDRTTTVRGWLESRWIVECRPRTAFLAYTRIAPDDRAPADVAIVFELHRGPFRAPWPADSRACGATVRGGADHDGACAACRRCFDADRRLSCAA